MSRVLNWTFDITAAGSPGTTDKTTDPLELTMVDFNCEMSCSITLSSLTGGTAPTVTSVLQGSNDGTNWVDLNSVGEVDAALMQSADGTGWLVLSGQATMPIPAMRLLRLRSTGGGDAPPTAWATQANLRIVLSEG